jgi:spore maturation protein B
MPLLVLIIILYGFFKKIDIYDTFIEGVKESFSMITSLFPTFIAMILAINLFINSGFLEFVLSLFKPLFSLINVPVQILPLAIVRPISGSASLAYLNNIFSIYGTDSFIGLLSSVMQGCTDTTFYVLTLYFGSVGIKKIRYSLFAGLCADLIGIIASIIVVNIFFY